MSKQHIWQNNRVNGFLNRKPLTTLALFYQSLISSSRYIFLHFSTYIVTTYLYSYLFIYQQLPPFGLRPHCRRLSTSLSYPRMNGEEVVPDPDITLIVDFRCTTGLAARAL